MHINVNACMFICSPQWVRINGTTYRPGCCIVIGFENMMPLFVRVDSILICAGEPIFICHYMETTRFEEHLRCYAIHQSTDNSSILSAGTTGLPSMPLHAHHTFSQTGIHLLKMEYWKCQWPWFFVLDCVICKANLLQVLLPVPGVILAMGGKHAQ